MARICHGEVVRLCRACLLPIGLLSSAEILRRICRKPLIWRHDALLWVALSVFGFVFVKVTPSGNDAYAWAIGAIRWPLQTVFHGTALEIRPILVSRDRTDLLALVVSFGPFLLIRNRTRGTATALIAVEPVDNYSLGRSGGLSGGGR